MDQAVKFEGNIGGIRSSLVPQEIIAGTLNSLDTEKKVASPFTQMAQGVVGAVRTVRENSKKQSVSREELIDYLDTHPDKMKDYLDPTYADYWKSIGDGVILNSRLVDDLFSISHRLTYKLYSFLDVSPNVDGLKQDLNNALLETTTTNKDIGAEIEVAAVLLPHSLPYKEDPPHPTLLDQFFQLDPRQVTQELVENTIRALESHKGTGQITYDQRRAWDREEKEDKASG